MWRSCAFEYGVILNGSQTYQQFSNDTKCLSMVLFWTVVKLSPSSVQLNHGLSMVLFWTVVKHTLFPNPSPYCLSMVLFWTVVKRASVA